MTGRIFLAAISEAACDYLVLNLHRILRKAGARPLVRDYALSETTDPADVPRAAGLGCRRRNPEKTRFVQSRVR
jgi:hypothetical protein